MLCRLSVAALLLGLLGAPLTARAAPLRVVATTAMVADLVRQVAGEDATVEGLMGPGVDPHLYKPVAADVLRLQRADVIFFNGLMLEGKMTEVLTRLGRTKPHLHAVAEAIPADLLLRSEGATGEPDPHVWLDVGLWTRCLETIERGLAAADPARAANYARRAAEVRGRLGALDAWVRAKTGELPPARRVLVTSHDAFGYFGRAYGFEVVGLQGLSTTTEAGLADVARLTDLIRARGVRAIFVESSVPHATIARVATDAGVRIGGELFSDAMGTPGQIENGYDLGTYEGMIRHNVTTLVEALK